MLVIASSFRKEYDSKTNLSLFIDSYHFLSSLGVKPSIGIGAYGGEEELSFSFSCNEYHPAYVYVLKHFLEERGQECVLYIREETKRSFLLYKRGFAGTFIGEWKEVSKDFALSQKNYSCFNGSYYVVS